MMTQELPPRSLWPRDGRFGAGPSKVRPAQIDELGHSDLWGTSHRQAGVIGLVQSIQQQLRELFSVPEGYEIVLGNGGATAFWATACVSLIREWGNFAVFGEFGGKFAADGRSAPWMNATVDEAPAGELAIMNTALPGGLGLGPDAYCYPHNETSTGVVSPLYRAPDPEALTLVDATSIAGAATVDLSLVDAYYFSLQKCFGADAGLWVAILSPRAVARAEELNRLSSRPQFGILNLTSAIKSARKGQTVNTPAIGTLLLVHSQLEWMLAEGGLAEMAARAEAGADAIIRWAESRPWATPFVEVPAWRSPVVSTVDLAEEISAGELAARLRPAGIQDIEGYRGLGRNQLRIASFPSIDQADIDSVLACIDWAVEH